jgi:hypothetical protein
VPVYWPGGVRHRGDVISYQAASARNRRRRERYCCPVVWVVRGRVLGGGNCAGLSTDAGSLADRFVVVVKLLLDAVGVERRDRVVRALLIRSTRLVRMFSVAVGEESCERGEVVR